MIEMNKHIENNCEGAFSVKLQAFSIENQLFQDDI